ncbi:Nucleotidyl transferase [Candidatus Methylomirabilis lanthanidiphila]|uniref:Nucleotidyl transferase n=1 Tax=Candidatus Methylomirabilis lanthanidiphila TaxID=2211376 RepID=A0A564ZNU2_9BACT|nr:NTP transferase domain-containing protein [Candidatus Methylomirabilis lanthanidiphila]VUZ86228.1 Nucleotidyl transferase [Candidatus Methylomirabilis lanthanidiphila]
MSGTTNHLWGIVLAGGEGKRLQSFIRSQFGTDRPKQYCRLFGGRSMLRHTLCRAEQLIPRERLVTVATRPHLPYAQEELYDRPPGTVIVQPSNRETGPGILLPLLHILQRDPKALVVLLPADHFIVEEARFMAYVEKAATFVATAPACLVLLGVEPKRPEPQYGWIEAGEIFGRHDSTEFYRVRRFREKPGPQVAQTLYLNGGLWNTMVVVGRAWWLLSLFKMLTPELFRLFNRFGFHLGSPQEAAAVEQIYARLPAVDFSQTILTKYPSRLAVLQVKDVYWSDWGNPAQVRQDLNRLECWPASGHGPEGGIGNVTPLDAAALV